MKPRKGKAVLVRMTLIEYRAIVRAARAKGQTVPGMLRSLGAEAVAKLALRSAGVEVG